MCPGCKQAASSGERIIVGGVQWHHKCYEATGKLSGPALKTNNISYVETCPVCKNALSATSGERIISGGQTVRASETPLAHFASCVSVPCGRRAIMRALVLRRRGLALFTIAR